MKRPTILTAARYVVFGVLFAACSTDVTGLQGPPGPAGPAGPPGKSVTADAGGGSDGAAASGVGLQLSAVAQRGLEISPVSLETAALTSAQAEQLGQGSYLVNAVCSCSDCHTPGSDPTKYLAGGTAYAVDNGAVVYARNLTPDATTGMTLTEDEFLTSLSTGKDFSDKTGNSVLLVMAWSHFRWMSTDDLMAIYAYLKAVPPVVNEVPPDMKGASALNGPPVPAPPSEYDEGDVTRPLPPVLDAQGKPFSDPNSVMRGLAIRPLDAPSDAVLQSLSAQDQATLGRGSYLANAAQCSDCHTNPPRLELRPGQPNYMHVNTADYLTGGRVFIVPTPLEPTLGQVRTMSSDLTGDTHGFLQQPKDSFARFLEILESGTHPGAAARVLGWPMPWQDFRNMTLDDLEALYTYLKSLPPFVGAADKDTAAYAQYCQGATDCAAGETCSGNECVGAACGSDTAGAVDASDMDGGQDGASADTLDICNACQSCQASQCAAPAANDPCLMGGI